MMQCSLFNSSLQMLQHHLGSSCLLHPKGLSYYKSLMPPAAPLRPLPTARDAAAAAGAAAAARIVPAAAMAVGPGPGATDSLAVTVGVPRLKHRRGLSDQVVPSNPVSAQGGAEVLQEQEGGVGSSHRGTSAVSPKGESFRIGHDRNLPRSVAPPVANVPLHGDAGVFMVQLHLDLPAFTPVVAANG